MYERGPVITAVNGFAEFLRSEGPKCSGVIATSSREKRAQGQRDQGSPEWGRTNRCQS